LEADVFHVIELLCDPLGFAGDDLDDFFVGMTFGGCDDDLIGRFDRDFDCFATRGKAYGKANDAVSVEKGQFLKIGGSLFVCVHRFTLRNAF
jgi:hypothetical protein